jgi:RNA-splicing ligase RtcB
MKLGARDQFTTVHNYIDINHMMLRKGAISAQAGERVIIPMNMRDGSILAIGKGNPEWNCSAPHGAGRLMSRKKAREMLSLKDFKSSMEGIFTTSVGKDTIDEAPAAYKPMREILDCIGETVEVERIIKPVYNFKAGDED